MSFTVHGPIIDSLMSATRGVDDVAALNRLAAGQGSAADLELAERMLRSAGRFGEAGELRSLRLAAAAPWPEPKRTALSAPTDARYRARRAFAHLAGARFGDDREEYAKRILLAMRELEPLAEADPQDPPGPDGDRSEGASS